MTLADITLPMPYEQAVGLALVFGPELAQRLEAIQLEVNDPMHRVAAMATNDGRYMLCGDVLSECDPGGIFYAGFSRLDTSRFSEITVVPLSQALALLPAAPPYPV